MAVKFPLFAAALNLLRVQLISCNLQIKKIFANSNKISCGKKRKGFDQMKKTH